MIGFIGAGNMGGALIRALFINNKVYSHKVWVYDERLNPSATKKKFNKIAIKPAKNELEIFTKCSIIFLGFKPKDSKKFLDRFSSIIKAKHILVSMIAGLTIKEIRTQAKNPRLKVCRIMPNLAAGIGKGTGTVTYSSTIGVKEKKLLANILSCSGTYVETRETLVNAVTSVSGCGPAFVFLFIEALTQGGKKVGLSEVAAKTFAIETILGATTLVKHSKKSPLQLTDQVTSPGGMTIEGVTHLKKSTFQKDVTTAVEKAFRKAAHLFPIAKQPQKNKK